MQVQRNCPIVTCGAGKQCIDEEMKKMEKQVSAPVETKAKGMRQQWCPLLSQEATVELSGAKQKVVRELTCCGQLQKQLRQITCVTGQVGSGDQGRANVQAGLYRLSFKAV